MKKSVIKKAALLSLTLSLAPALVPSVAPIAMNVARADDGSAALLLLLLFTTTWAQVRRYDAVKAQTLIDQAAMGYGDKLDLIATASGRTVEDVAERINAMAEHGEIDANQPEAMAQAIQAAFLK